VTKSADVMSMQVGVPPTSLERTANALGSGGMVVVALVMGAHGLLDGDMARAIPSLVLMVLFGYAWRTRKIGIVALAWACVIAAMVGGTLIDDELNRVASIIGLVSLAAVLATFARRRVMLVVFGVAVIGGSAPLIWEGSVELSIVVFSASLISGWLIAGLRSEIESALQRSERLLEYAPVPIMRQDWSGVEEGLAEIRRGGVTDLETYLMERPDAVLDLISRVRLISANLATAAFYEAASKEAVFNRFNQRTMEPGSEGQVNIRSFEQYRSHLLGMWRGDPIDDVEFPTYDMAGREIWGRVRWVPDPDHPEARIIGVADITELKRIQSELEEMNRSKDRFVASVSHELRTPLAAVVGFANELVDHPDMFHPEERVDLLRLVRDEAQEVANIIEDLLVAARADMDAVVVMHEPLDAVAEIEHLLSSCPPGFGSVEVADVPAVCGDAVRFRQILRNLITNAARYGGPDRSVRVIDNGCTVVIEVADDGTGLSSDDMARIFDPYARAHAPSGTTDSVGLGLTVSRLLAELMGGSLLADRRDGMTIFRLELPAWGSCPSARERIPTATG
jgi:signal transduction histidine kinase